MSYFVSMVFGMRFPRQMIAGNAACMPLAAGMGGLMLWRWGCAVVVLTHNPGNNAKSPAPQEGTIAISITGKRPDEAVVSFVFKGNVGQEACGFTRFGHVPATSSTSLRSTGQNSGSLGCSLHTMTMRRTPSNSLRYFFAPNAVNRCQRVALIGVSVMTTLTE